jgi:predicted dehydrogenase
MTQQALRVAVIGYGWWGKTIVATLQSSPLLKVEMVIEQEEAPRLAAQALGATQDFTVSSMFEDAIANPNVEAVVLCTPHKLHAAQIAAAAKAGKHVFCEKPLCLSFADAVQAVAACKAANVQLGIGHERRFEPAIIELRRRIANGDLGTILQIEGNFSQDKFFALPPDNWRLSKELAPCGPLSATGIHLVDLAIAILGPADNVLARLNTLASNFANGDTLAVMLSFKSGATALISAILATPFDGRFTVYGSKGWIEVRDRTHPENPTGWDISTVLSGKEKQAHYEAPHTIVRANLEAFANGVRGISPYPVTTAEMLANVAALESIMKSAESGQIEQIPVITA